MTPDRAALLAVASALLFAGCDRQGQAGAPPRSPHAAARQPASASATAPQVHVAMTSGQSRYGRLSVDGGTGSQVVTLNGRPILRGAELDADSMTFKAIFAQGDQDLVVLELEGEGDSCPVRAAVLDIGPGGVARPSPPFGTCAAVRAAHLEGDRLFIDMPGWRATGAPPPPTRYAYLNGRITETALSETALKPDNPEEGPPAQRPSLKWIGPQGCRVYAGRSGPDPVSQLDADALAKDFEATYPKALADPARVDTVDLTPERLDRIARCLAALSTWPGTDGFVPDQAAALFASKRYGAQAFAALDRLAAAPAEDARMRAAARAFAAQMKDYGAHPG